VFADRFNVLPEQRGELLDGEGVPGVAFTVTAVVDTGDVPQPAMVRVTL
jgi:hypothetical protein